MKRLLKPLSMILAAAAIVGCSKSNNSKPNSSQTTIVGKWSYSADTIKTYNNGALEQTDTNGGVTASDFFQFNSDGTCEQVLSGGSTNYTYVMSDGKLTINAPAQLVGGYQESAYTEVATVKTLTSTDLFLYFDDTDVYSGVTSETTEAAHFKKQ